MLMRILMHDFPHITQHNFRQTSQAAIDYNCIAWAYGRNDVWCWPSTICFWPIARCEETVDAFEELFSSIGYKRCVDASLECGFLKIVLYVKDGKPTHAARQLATGKWTSKLGQNIDIEHDTPDVLNGPGYGVASVYMKRPC